MSLTHAQRRRLQDLARGRGEPGLHLLEGAKSVRDALGAGVVRELYLADGLDGATAGSLQAAAATAGVPVLCVAGADLERASDTVTPQGVLAVVADTAEPLERLLQRPGLLAWLDGVQDPGNVGAVVRVAVAFGAAGLLVGAGSADPLGVKALRASAGLALRLPFARAGGEAIAQALAAARRPVWLLEKGGHDVFATEQVPPGLVLVVGSEGSGPSAAARAAATGSVGIPIRPEVESLNAAVAAGLVLGVLSRRLAR
ncbi:MAG: TrmH family RNA methyltransferase [Planctomycetia bacterium]